MGSYFNPGNESFLQILRGDFYVDKTGLIKYTNAKLDTPNNCIAVSHARRFGKTQVARMLKAYYSRGCDSSQLFSNFEIASHSDFHIHLNKYNVIHIDMLFFLESYKEEFISNMVKDICDELNIEYTSIKYNQPFAKILKDIKDISGISFVIIIDEWDCVIRQYKNNTILIHSYLQFLHSIFKSELSGTFLALAYITGIMPIKKIKDESALNNFTEFTMLKSMNLTQYFGFTQKEVKKLCKENGMNFKHIKEWYDGYIINGQHIYNPNSVYNAIINKSIDSYWTNTSHFESINDYITKEYFGLKADIMIMLAKERVKVNTNLFSNDLSKINTKDDALTALIHLGYLGYDSQKGEAFIPNHEVIMAFNLALQRTDWEEVNILSNSEELLKATIEKDTSKVKELLDIAHDKYTDFLTYNNEAALKCTIMMAYFAAWEFYTLIPEFPTGKGFADIAFIPKRKTGGRPAMIVELKYDQNADSALKQIKERRYTGGLKGYSKEILLVGINYDPKEKEHQCQITSLSL